MDLIEKQIIAASENGLSVGLGQIAQSLQESRQQITEQMLTPQQIQNKLKENSNIHQRLQIERQEKEAELLKLKVELRILQAQKENLNEVKQYADESVSKTHDEVLLESTRQLKRSSKAIEARMGIRLKISPEGESETKRWIANFMFDATQDECTEYVSMIFDESLGRFELIDMKPKHPNFKQLQEFLKETNDISGFLGHCKSFFQSKENQ